MPPNDSPLWILAYIVVGGAVGTIACSVLYKNGFAVQDILTIVSIIASMGGVKGLQILAGREKP